MLTGIGRMEMRVRDLDACRAFYGGAMGLTELASGGRGGGRSATFVVGESVLECIEDPNAVVGEAADRRGEGLGGGAGVGEPFRIVRR